MEFKHEFILMQNFESDAIFSSYNIFMNFLKMSFTWAHVHSYIFLHETTYVYIFLVHSLMIKLYLLGISCISTYSDQIPTSVPTQTFLLPWKDFFCVELSMVENSLRHIILF